MIAQVYIPVRYKWLSTYLDKTESFDFKLGDLQAWKVKKDDNKLFTSLGGSTENPLKYKWKENGFTTFEFNITSPNYPNLDSDIDISSSLAYYEMWIKGTKEYYYRTESTVNALLFSFTASLYGLKDQETDFKFRITIPIYSTPEPKKFYFDGGEDPIVSSITAKFIPDTN